MKSIARVGLLLVAVASLGCGERARLHVEPVDAMVYEPVRVRLTGVPDNEAVVVRAVMIDDDGVRWESANRFRPQDGIVDLSEHAPLSGSYDEVSAMGFVWSMTPTGGEEGQPPGFKSSSLEPLTIDLTVQAGGGEVFERQLIRRTLRPGVRRVEVREDGLVGTLFLPEGAVDVPGVLLLGGSGGEVGEREVALLASEGYVTFALAYFGMEGLPETLSSIPLEYFEAAIQHLQGRPEADPDRIAVMGASRGGELALLLGATYPQIRGVIAIVPSGLVWFGLGPDGPAPTVPAWTLGGEPVPHVTAPPDPGIQQRFLEALASGEPASWTPVARSIMENELRARTDAVIAVERVNGPILMFSGVDDALWPSGPLAEVARRRLEEHDFRFAFEHVSYPEAGHVFPPPYLPAKYGPNRIGLLPGGTPEGTARAREDCWRRILQFLQENLENNASS